MESETVRFKEGKWYQVTKKGEKITQSTILSTIQLHV